MELFYCLILARLLRTETGKVECTWQEDSHTCSNVSLFIVYDKVSQTNGEKGKKKANETGSISFHMEISLHSNLTSYHVFICVYDNFPQKKPKRRKIEGRQLHGTMFKSVHYTWTRRTLALDK